MRYQRIAARLRGPVAVCFELLQSCDSPSLCILSCCKLATARRCVFWALQNLRQPVAVYFEAMQSCDSPSLCILGVAKSATARRCVFRALQNLRQLVAVRFEVHASSLFADYMGFYFVVYLF